MIICVHCSLAHVKKSINECGNHYPGFPQTIWRFLCHVSILSAGEQASKLRLGLASFFSPTLSRDLTALALQSAITLGG